jgi:hypothetical protein
MNECRVLVGSPERQRPLGRSVRGWELSIKIDLRETVWEVWTEFIRLGLQISGNLL